MAHRGRLNVLAHVVEKPFEAIFREFEELFPEGYVGDVKYHLGHSTDVETPWGPVHVSLNFNPSHLEFVNPVALGRVRAKQDRFGDRERKRGLAVLVHGDAAFIGEGIVQETLNLSQLPGYRVGAPSTWWPTTSWASPPSPRSTPPAATPRTSPRWWGRPSST